MSRANALITAAAAAALLLSALPADARRGNIEAGREKSKVCQACHGTDGNGVGNPEYPLLAGQYADYLLVSLQAYRSGERQNAIMQGFAATLDDQDMADLAAFYASQTGPLKDLRDARDLR